MAPGPAHAGDQDSISNTAFANTALAPSLRFLRLAVSRRRLFHVLLDASLRRPAWNDVALRKRLARASEPIQQSLLDSFSHLKLGL